MLSNLGFEKIQIIDMASLFTAGTTSVESRI